MAKIVQGMIAPVENNPVSTYRFIASQMSGDGDAYDTITFDFTDVQEATNFGVMLEMIGDIQDSGYCREVSEVFEGLKQKLDPAVFDAVFSKRKYPEDLVSDILGRDATCDGMPASFDGYELYYFNNNGVKYSAELEI